MNILKADLFHFKKDKMTYIIMAIVFILPLITCIMYSSNGSEFTAETVIFNGLGTDIFCVLVGFFLSIFYGREYSNNTIRNKICYGESRYKIVITAFIETILITLFFVAVSIVSSLLFSKLFGTVTFGEDFTSKLICQIALILAFAVLNTGVVLSSKSMKVGIMFTIVVSVILNSVAYILPTLASNGNIAKIACKCLYMVVSSMLISSTGGVYTRGDLVFDNLFENAIYLSIAYVAITFIVTCFVVRKHEYK